MKTIYTKFFTGPMAYVQDIAASGAISGNPYICSWVVGQKIAAGVAKDKSLRDETREYGRIRATTFSTLVDTANRRLLKLRDILSARYGKLPTDSLLDRVLNQPEQLTLPWNEN